jgi:hypothetical protein
VSDAPPGIAQSDDAKSVENAAKQKAVKESARDLDRDEGDRIECNRTPEKMTLDPPERKCVCMKRQSLDNSLFTSPSDSPTVHDRRDPHEHGVCEVNDGPVRDDSQKTGELGLLWNRLNHRIYHRLFK